MNITDERLGAIIYELTESPSKPFWLEQVAALTELQKRRLPEQACEHMTEWCEEYLAETIEGEWSVGMPAALVRLKSALNKAIRKMEGISHRRTSSSPLNGESDGHQKA